MGRLHDSYGRDGPRESGGVSLYYKVGEAFRLENAMVRGPNCITFELQTGCGRYYVVGAYLPPLDMAASFRVVKHALDQIPKGCILMVLGDLNSNLDVPRNEQEAEIAATMDSLGLACATKHFRVRCYRRRRRRQLQGRWSYRRRRSERGENGRGWYHTKPDYLLLPARERRKVRRCRFVMLPGHSTDHRALVALLHTGDKGNMAAYRRKME